MLGRGVGLEEPGFNLPGLISTSQGWEREKTLPYTELLRDKSSLELKARPQINLGAHMLKVSPLHTLCSQIQHNRLAGWFVALWGRKIWVKGEMRGQMKY